jgi:choline transport protein
MLTNTAYALPTTTQTMNYNSVILVGVVALTAFWWLVHGRSKYAGPKMMLLHTEGVDVPEKSD